MQKIRREDILDIAAYEKVRQEFRAGVMALKAARRISLGEYLTLVFENRQTVTFQIQEMMRVERIVHDEPIQREIDIYNQLIPPPGSLSATLFIEVTEYGRIREVLDRFVGLQSNCVFIEIDGQRIVAAFDLDQFSDTRVSAVQYITFAFTPGQAARLRESDSAARIVVDHPNYHEHVDITGELRRQLIEDLS
jgi:hypothetical protein